MTTTYLSRKPRYMNRYNKMYRTGVRLSTDATVPARQVQALRAIGYSNAVIAEGTGLTLDAVSKLVSGKRVRVYLDTAKVIREFYDSHQDVPASGPHAQKVRTWATKARLAPPAAWDDINDPTERPKGVLRK